jgi:hypothetical protein
MPDGESSIIRPRRNPHNTDAIGAARSVRYMKVLDSPATLAREWNRASAASLSEIMPFSIYRLPGRLPVALFSETECSPHLLAYPETHGCYGRSFRTQHYAVPVRRIGRTLYAAIS